MRSQSCSAAVLAFSLCVCASALARDFVGFLRSANLPTPQFGWASTDTRLFRTTDAGLHWNDITPSAGKSKTLAHTFFLDASNGWVALAETDEDGNSKFELASTTDGGANWALAPLNVPDFDPGRGLSAFACVDFVDTQHGWIMLRMNGSTAVSICVLLVTADGGKSWTLPGAGPPIAGPVRFTDLNRGWLAGAPDDRLYATNDGGQSWQEVALAAPPPLDASAQPTYYLPMVATADAAFLPVAFFEPNGEKRSLALFRSSDGGRIWGPGGVLRMKKTAWATTVAGSSWITTSVSGGSLTVSTAPLAEKISGAVTPAKVSGSVGLAGIGLGAIGVVGFADNACGWALLTSGELPFTSSGGAAWTEITPPAARTVHPWRRDVPVPVN